MASFRKFIWDPALIISQIFFVQSSFYASQCFLMILFSFLFGYEPRMESIFSVQVQRTSALIQILSSIAVSFSLLYLVQRAKQCLDFACTVHLFHLIFVIIANKSIPTSFIWWILQILSITVCTILGEYLCMRAESQEILLEGGTSKYDV